MHYWEFRILLKSQLNSVSAFNAESSEAKADWKESFNLIRRSRAEVVGRRSKIGDGASVARARIIRWMTSRLTRLPAIFLLRCVVEEVNIILPRRRRITKVRLLIVIEYLCGNIRILNDFAFKYLYFIFRQIIIYDVLIKSKCCDRNCNFNAAIGSNLLYQS